VTYWLLKMGVSSDGCRPVMDKDMPLMGALMGKGTVPADEHGKS